MDRKVRRDGKGFNGGPENIGPAFEVNRKMCVWGEWVGVTK